MKRVQNQPGILCILFILFTGLVTNGCVKVKTAEWEFEQFLMDWTDVHVSVEPNSLTVDLGSAATTPVDVSYNPVLGGGVELGPDDPRILPPEPE